MGHAHFGLGCAGISGKGLGAGVVRVRLVVRLVRSAVVAGVVWVVFRAVEKLAVKLLALTCVNAFTEVAVDIVA